MPTQEQVTGILNSLAWDRLMVGEVIVALLQNHTFYPDTIKSICIHAPQILDMFADVPGAKEAVMEHVVLKMQDMCMYEVIQLVKKDTGFQFGACHIQESQLVEADINEMAIKMEGVASMMWNILDNLLSANTYINHR